MSWPSARRGPHDRLRAKTVSGTDPEKEAPDRRRIKQMEVMVAEAVQETADTTTLVFFTGNDRLDYKAGHFLTIDPHQFEGLERFIAFLEDLKGKKEPPRAYSMASSPHEKYLAVTVKEERYVTGLTQYPPLLSPLLVKRIPRGTRLVVTGFTGPYTLADDIERLAQSGFDGSERDRQLAQLLARVTAAELRFRAAEGPE